MFHNSQWGTVCNTGWSFENAFVACVTAGFNSAVRGLSDANTYFGPGTGPVWLDNVVCTGNEATLFDCDKGSWGAAGAHCSGHDSDAGVVCSDGELSLSSLSLSGPSFPPSLPPSLYLLGD